ncbi:MAG: XRE family transcriptional regulator [Candidatus Nanopelagicales bacterium]|jgi:transcriptional regulator with XRE-family HTH domain|nr:XRE family transcriptional regulator [Candidatus Nanopelagicales bacterium]
MDEAAALGALIGERVRSERKRRAWTLDQLAGRSGVSRRMLITIEQGGTNPSIATLLRLSDALGVGLPSLVAPGPSTRVDVRKAADRSALWTSDNGGQAFLTAGTDPPDVVELWDWHLGPGDDYRSEAHSEGTWELLAVLKGNVRLTVEAQTWDLRVGDSVSFPGDVPHAYANPGTRAARFALTVYEPDVGANR